MRRLVDADELCKEFRKRQMAALNWKEGAILANNEESIIRADATLAFLSEVKLIIDNVPTVDCIEVERAKELIEEGYQKGHIDGVLQGEKLYAGKCLDWIPTSEMLPERYDSYLVMWRRRDENADRLFYEIIEYEPSEDGEDGEWGEIEQAGEAGAEIVAWMSLPEPYKEVQNND